MVKLARAELIIPSEVAMILKRWLPFKRDTVYKWITRKKMPAHKVGSLWKFRRDEIDDWVRSGDARDNGTMHGDTN